MPVAIKSIYKDANKRLAMVLCEERKNAGMTQVSLATLLNKPQSFVAKYENCERRLDVIEFIEITRMIGVSYQSVLDQVFGEK